MQSVKAYFTIIGPFQRRYFMIVGLVLVFQVVKLLPPYVFSQLLDLLTNYKTSMRSSVMQLAVLIFGLRALVNVIDRVLEYVNTRFFSELQFYLQTTAFYKALHQPFVEHESKLSGTQITQVQRGYEAILWEMTGESFWNFWPIVLGVLTSVGMLLPISPLATGIFLIPTPILLFLVYKMNYDLLPVREEVEVIADKNWGRFGDLLGNIQVVLAFAREKWEEAKYAERQGQIKKLMITMWDIEANYFLVWALVIILSKLGLLIFSILLQEQGQISLGELVLINTLSDMAYSSFYRLYFFARRVARSVPRAQRLKNLFEQPNDLRDTPNAIALENIKGQIEFNEVSFVYPNNGCGPALREQGVREALRSVSFTAKSGETIAIVGQSGSGKTTLMKLLLRFYTPNQGEILIDGVPLSGIKRESYLGHIGYVPQGVFLLKGSIYANIAHGAKRPDKCSLSLVSQAAKRANAHDFISRLPMGYETEIGEDGTHVSGGEGQRLMVARALVEEPAILIFDEATSHLDPISERMIQRWLKRQSQKRCTTMIIIAHRLSTIIHADKIVVLSGGRVEEMGTHDELLRRRGAYYSLYQAQKLGKA